MKKFFTIGLLVLLIVGGGIFWWRHYYVFGEGVKAGDLNYLVKKGYIFKTWEGKLIQTGFKTPVPGAIQSNEFQFSITDERVAASSKGPAAGSWSCATRNTSRPSRGGA